MIFGAEVHNTQLWRFVGSCHGPTRNARRFFPRTKS